MDGTNCTSESGTNDLPALICSECAETYPVRTLAWHCRCGGMLDVQKFATPVDPAALAGRAADQWRYREVLPIGRDASVSLGEGMSPLVPSGALGNVRLKLDYLMPTLSFKDRGAVMLATLAKRIGITRAAVDSSGNAGTAEAAYFARAGIPCEVLVPASTSPAKLSQMRAHGATVTLVPGSRADISAAALEVVERPGVFYASHVYHPYLLHGVKTYGYEIWEQLGFTLPDTVVVPAGNGTMVLGCHLAFEELLRFGLIERLPTLIAVQAAACSPLENAAESSSPLPEPMDGGTTIAEGIAISAPPRGRQILAAVRATGGTVVSVTDEQTSAARSELAAEGLFVEPTSAVCWAAVRAAADGDYDAGRSTWRAAHGALTADQVVVPLCGAGLKSPGEGRK